MLIENLLKVTVDHQGELEFEAYPYEDDGRILWLTPAQARTLVGFLTAYLKGTEKQEDV